MPDRNRSLMAGPGLRFCLCLWLGLLSAPVAAQESPDLPVLDPARSGSTPLFRGVRNLYSQDALRQCLRDGDSTGLFLNLTGISVLLDSSRIDPEKIRGRVYVAPVPTRATASPYEVLQFGRGSAISKGKGTLPLLDLRSDWEGGPAQGQVAVHLELFLETETADRDLGTYEFLTNFAKREGRWRKAAGLIEGPSVGLLRSDDPAGGVIWFSTDQPVSPAVILREADQAAGGGQLRQFAGPEGRKHEIRLTGLRPATAYTYSVQVGDWTSPAYTFRTAPPKGEGTVRFAFLGDCRDGPGGGSRAFMGVNAFVVGSELNAAWREGCAFLLQGGDLANGYTPSVEDFRTQLRAFKWVASSFLHTRPIYALMGNHDALIRPFQNPNKERMYLDRWPYSSESSEAVFADELVLPDNGPLPADPRRPPYQETVYSFQYGPVCFVALNTDYWVSTAAEQYGGSPEGYLLSDQLAWAKERLDAAEKAPTVRYIILYAHTPALPNGGHGGSAMWHDGDNAVRGYSVAAEATAPGERRPPRPEKEGVVETRRAILEMATAHSKVAAVLCSDEHNYSRILLNRDVPVGDPARDDKDDQGRICQEGHRCSPLADLPHPTWFLTSGGGGAPYYLYESMPWNRYWLKSPASCPDSAGCFHFVEDYHWLLFEAGPERISMSVYDLGGSVMDRCEDLMRVKVKRER